MPWRCDKDAVTDSSATWTLRSVPSCEPVMLSRSHRAVVAGTMVVTAALGADVTVARVVQFCPSVDASMV